MSAGPAPQRQAYLLALSTLVAVCAGFLFGYDNLVMSGAISYLKRYFDLDQQGEGWAAGCAALGCAIGTIGAGRIVDRLGAKFGLWLCALCFGASSLGIYFFYGSFLQFYAWRMIGGLGIGAASIVAPMYIAEIAPARARGRLVTLYQFGIVLGILSAVFANMLIQRMGDDAWNVAVGWRVMFVAGTVPALLFAAMIGPSVESPRWLMKVGRRQQAFDTLCRLNGSQAATDEAREIEQSLVQEQGGLAELFTSGFRRALIIGLMLAGLSQLSGIYPLLSFLPDVLTAAGAATRDAFTQSVQVGAILAVATLAALCLVDVAGRKTLILFGTFLQLVSFAAVAWLFHTGGASRGVLVALMTFVAAHAVGNGAVCWVIISEIFPTKVRGSAMWIATLPLWLVAAFMNMVFPLMRDRFGYSVTFGLFAAAALVNLLFVLRRVPETKGRTLEQIEEIWNAPRNAHMATPGTPPTHNSPSQEALHEIR